MRNACGIGMMVILGAVSCGSACGRGMPASEVATAVILRASDGWWIRINRYGGGAYGFGTVPSVVRVPAGTFAFQDVLDDIDQTLPRELENAEAPYMTVSYSTAGANFEELQLARDDALLQRLFACARAGAVTLGADGESRWRSQVDVLWRQRLRIGSDKPEPVDCE